uniref:Uncharacterized protein n=1 Tax=Rhizophora mucronata TaxID=61149 RepID=A0A2P2QXN4_RHIMU
MQNILQYMIMTFCEILIKYFVFNRNLLIIAICWL